MTTARLCLAYLDVDIDNSQVVLGVDKQKIFQLFQCWITFLKSERARVPLVVLAHHDLLAIVALISTIDLFLAGRQVPITSFVTDEEEGCAISGKCKKSTIFKKILITPNLSRRRVLKKLKFQKVA